MAFNLESSIFGRNLSSGKSIPIGKPEWVLASSSNSPWRDSFKVEHHIRPSYEQVEITLAETNVHFFSDRMKAPIPVEWRIGGSHLHKKLMVGGDIGIASRGASVWGRCLGPSEVTIISFAPHFLDRCEGGRISGRPVELKPLQHNRDNKIHALGSLLEAEARAGFATGRIYGEALGTALAAHVLENYAVIRAKVDTYIGGLSTHNLRRVLDYISSNPAEDIGLQELADLIQISPFHFCRAFKQSTGTSPYRYILRLRVEEAKRLLKNRQLSISEIGSRVGFPDQSHFTMIFRKFLGTSPARWRMLL